MTAKKRDEVPKMKMFCFCHAGGLAGYYSFLKEANVAGVDEVNLFEYPGRGRSYGQKGYKNFDECVEDSCKKIAKSGVQSEEFILFGHSMGAFVAYETACKLQKDYNLYPYHVFVSGQKPPVRVEPSHYAECEEKVLEFLKRLGGVPEIILKNKEMTDFFMDICIKDLRVLQSYVPHEAVTDNLPKRGSVICGDEDAEVAQEELADWKAYFGTEPDIHIVHGNHFYISEKKDELISFMNRELRRA